jgi:hypothetical protein
MAKTALHSGMVPKTALAAGLPGSAAACCCLWLLVAAAAGPKPSIRMLRIQAHLHAGGGAVEDVVHQLGLGREDVPHPAHLRKVLSGLPHNSPYKPPI